MSKYQYARTLWFVFAIVVSTFGVESLQAQGIDRAISSIINAPAYRGVQWSIEVRDLETDDVLYDRSSGVRLIPGSNVKIYTTAAALEQLHPAYRFQTDLYISGYISDGTLQGDLIVRGGGDPLFGGDYPDKDDPTRIYRAWADTLKSLGIRRINGNIIGDDDFFDDVRYGQNWDRADLVYWYGAEISGLTFNENTVDIRIAAGQVGRRGTVDWQPFRTDYVSVINATTTGRAGTRLDEGYSREMGTNTIRLFSRVPFGKIDPEPLSVDNATRFAVYIFKQTLERENITVTGEAVDVDELVRPIRYLEPEVKRVATHFSPTLAQVAAYTNKESHNLYAEQTLKTLAAEREPGMPGSAQRGITVANETFARAGIDTTRLILVDGSGLSTDNLLSADMSVDLLGYMWHHPDREVRQAFFDSLPIGGIDGSLKNRFKTGAAYANVRAKTGTVSKASSLAGYVRTQDGRMLAFAIMCNNFRGGAGSVRAAQDRIVNLLAGLTQ